MTDAAHENETELGWRHGYVGADELRPRRERARRDRRGRLRAPRPRSGEQRRGVALILVIAAISVLAIFVSDLIGNSSTEFHIANSERDRLKAEYLARSGVNLTRLLIAQEPNIRRVAGVLYQMMLGRAAPQLNVWDFASTLLAPFADYKNSKGMTQTTGLDFNLMKGIKDTGGTFEVLAVPENSKINLNVPLFYSGDDARKSTAMQLFALLGGYQSPQSPYDPMFSARDPDGQYTTRLDIVSSIIDWWDYDDQRTVFDPGASSVTVGGSEDNIYGQYPDPYVIKNAPFDSLEELRLIRGVGDDFWATFIEGKPNDLKGRKVTIYGSGAVNVNLAPPDVLLARMCSFATSQPLCRDPLQAMAFISMFNTARMFVPVPLFSTPNDFLDFISGGGTAGAAGTTGPNGAVAPGAGTTPAGAGGMNMYAMLMGFLGKDSPLMLWTPMVLTPDLRNQVGKMFLTDASIFSVRGIGRVGQSTTTITAVVNFDRAWTPPKGVAGVLPGLGVLHYYRVE